MVGGAEAAKEGRRMKKHIFTTTLRLNLEDGEQRRAWGYLQHLNKKEYRSYSEAIAAAVNDYFERRERLSADPYLETREKEDAFLHHITATIEQALRAAPVTVGVIPQLMQAAPPALPTPAKPDDEDISAAFDFVDSL